MIDTLAKRSASSRFALGGSGIRPPSGTFSQIERGYTLGLYTFTYVASDVPYLSLDFASNRAATGTITALSATATLTAYTATGTLVVIEVEQ